MPRAIYVNLPVADVGKNVRFFEKLGFTFDSRFTNEQAAALMISGNIVAMIQTHESFHRFTSKAIVEPARGIEVILSIQLDSREEVDELMDKVPAAGGREQRPAEDSGFMYLRAFEDPDGHVWELFWMDATRMPG